MEAGRGRFRIDRDTWSRSRQHRAPIGRWVSRPPDEHGPLRATVTLG